MRGLFLAGFVTLLLAVTGAAAQQAGEASFTATRIEAARLDASLAVLDAAGNPVSNLGAGDFRAQLDGREIALTRVESGVDTALPIGLVLTVDTSGSMSGDAIAAARAALAPLATSLATGDEATLITFAQTVSTVVARTSDKAALEAAIRSLPASGNTALFAATATAAAATSEHPQPRRAVVFLSDGEDFGNASAGVTREQALDAARAAGVPFFVVGLGQEIDQQFLTSLARDTGGQYFAAATPAELAQLYSRISERLRRQYTVSLQLPADLAAGDHRFAVTVGGATASTTFVTVATNAPRRATFAGLPPMLVVPATIRLIDAPPGQSLQFELDGAAIPALSDGRSLRLDPYAFAPGPHVLVVRDSTGAVLVESAFEVAALFPRLLEPFEIPNLAPGDLVRLTIETQPGTTTVRYLLDGDELERDDGPPYEVVLPAEVEGSGAHELTIVASNGGGEFRHGFQFELAGRSSNLPTYLALAAVALAAAVGLGLGGRLALSRVRRREPRATAAGDVGGLASWVSETRRAAGHPDSSAAESAPGHLIEVPWGTLVVLEGPDAGKTFELREDTELVGRGKFCTVRLSDKALHDAHFLLTRDGTLTPSTPACRVEVDGEAPGARQLAAGARVRAGKTLLSLQLAAWAGRAEPPPDPYRENS